MIVPQDIYLPMYEDTDHFIYLITGGRGSGKSFNVGTFLERLTFEEGHTILDCRYTMTSASISVIPEFNEKIELDGTEEFFDITKTDITNKVSGSKLLFRGIKTSSGNQTAKLKSIQGISTFVCDEAEEWTSESDFDKMVLSIRQKGVQNRVIIVMNPTDSSHFIYRKYIQNTHKIVEYDGVPVQISTHPNVLHIHTTYLDNIENLSDQFIQEVGQMKKDNPEKYAHVVMGRWVDVAEGAIFKNISVVKEFPDDCEKVALGQDFGYTNDQTAIVKCGIKGDELYIDELCYRSYMLTKDIVEELKKNRHLKVMSESADPRLITEIHNAGILIYPVDKSGNSIIAGIEKMREYKIHVTERSFNVLQEFRNYVWDKDKDEKPINRPADGQQDHCFTGDTLISTSEGEKRIDAVKVGDYVLTSRGFYPVKKVFLNGRKEVFVFRLIFRNFAIIIKATEDHKVKTSTGWKQIKDLQRGDRLFVNLKSSMVKYIGDEKVNHISQTNIAKHGFAGECAQGNTLHQCDLKGIEIALADICDVFDLEVSSVHEYVANGVLVHNCMDAIRYYVLGMILGKILKPKRIDPEKLGIW